MITNQYGIAVNYAPIPTRNPELPDDRPDKDIIRFYGSNLSALAVQSKKTAV